MDNFKDQEDFWYVPRDVEDTSNNGDWRRDENWWLPVVKVPSDGLSEESRKLLQSQKDSVAQVLKAATAINDVVLSEINIPDNYIDSLPKVINFFMNVLNYSFTAKLIYSCCCFVEWEDNPWRFPLQDLNR